MAYLNNGKERSITIKVVKTINGVPVAGYENKIYDGRLAFENDYEPFDAITDEELSKLTDEQFEYRLDSFISYVEMLENGLRIRLNTEAGHEAIRDNPTACPIGQE